MRLSAERQIEEIALKLSKTLLVTTVAATAATSAVFVAGPASASPTIAGTYNAVTATRVLDTRNGIGAPKAAIGAGKTVTFSATKPISSKLVSAEALTITAVSPAAGGFLLAYTGGGTKPNTSTLNFAKAKTISNTAVVGYGASGTVSIFNSSTAPVQVVADLSGYWTGGSVGADTGGAFQPVANSRIFQTTTLAKPLAGGADLSVPVAGKDTIPASGASAVLVNVTAVRPAAAGFLTATANPTDQEGAPRTNDLSFGAGQARASLVVVPVDPDTGAISIHNGSAGATDVFVDAVGYITGGTPFEDGAIVPSTPYRNTDSRTGPPIGSGKTTKIDIGVGSDNPLFKSVIVAVTETGATTAGYFTAWNGTGARPGIAMLNFANQTATTTQIVPLNADGTFTVFNGALSSAAITVDVHGFVLNDISGTPDQARAKVRTALARAHKVAAARVNH